MRFSVAMKYRWICKRLILKEMLFCCVTGGGSGRQDGGWCVPEVYRSQPALWHVPAGYWSHRQGNTLFKKLWKWGDKYVLLVKVNAGIYWHCLVGSLVYHSGLPYLYPKQRVGILVSKRSRGRSCWEEIFHLKLFPQFSSYLNETSFTW